MRVDEDVVPGNVRSELGDVSDTPHVGGELIHLIHFARGCAAAVELAEIDELELIGLRLFEPGKLDINASNPVSVGLQELHHVVSDEASCPRDESPSIHGASCR